MSTTPNLGLSKPSHGAQNWDVDLNANFDVLDTRLGEIANVKDFGAVGNGSTDDHIAIQAAVDSDLDVFFPPGNYGLGTGNTITLSRSGQSLRGCGRGATTITTNNAYAFTVPANCFEYVIAGFAVMSNGTTGGAVKCIDGTSGGTLERIYADCSGVLTTPMYEMSHQIGTLLVNCQASGSSSATGGGFRWGAAGYNNTNTMLRCRGAAQDGPGLLFVGGWGFHLLDCTFESNRGYGIEFDGDCSGVTVERCWFEDNWNHHIYAHGLGLYASTIRENSIFYTHAAGSGGDADASAIVITTENANLRHHVQVVGNYFVDPSNSGVGISIGDGVFGTYIQGNRVGAGYASDFLDDSGTGTVWFANDDYVSGHDFYSGGFSMSTGATGSAVNGFLIDAGTSRNTDGESSNPNTRPFAVGNMDGGGTSNWVSVTTEGHLDIHSGDGPSANVLQTNSFSPYWKSATNWPRFYSRGSSGSTGGGSYVVASDGEGYALTTAATASTPGSVVKKIPVWSESAGAVIGYIALYDGIS